MNAETVRELKDHIRTMKDITLTLITNVEKEQYDELDNLIEKRQFELDAIEKMEVDKNILKEVCINFGILPLQQKLSMLLLEKRNKTQREINSLNMSVNANNQYNNRFASDAMYLSKKI